MICLCVYDVCMCADNEWTVRYGLSLVSSHLSSQGYYCSEIKTFLYLDIIYCKFLLYVSVEINPFNHRYFSTQTNLVYLGLVYVTMITGTCM